MFKLIVVSQSILMLFFNWTFANGQCDRWQLSIDYKMEVDMYVDAHRYLGRQWVTLYNNSPDTLHQMYFHLYLNAFQPGSSMDMRSLTLPDADHRVGDRINKLAVNEIGFQRIQKIQQGAENLSYEVFETIARIDLHEPLLPGTHTTVYMEYDAQVPVHIRRMGRMNNEGIHYSMAQWYPKVCQYDEMGWHTNPYIGREFYGIFGNFDVKIRIDSRYTIGGTGYIQNAEAIGKGYCSDEVNPTTDLLDWHFKAENVHDFMWAADPEYHHTSAYTEDSILLRFFYRQNEHTENWELLPAAMQEAFKYIQQNYGKYHYKSYAFVQGGDGGMEYPMSTLITGHRNLHSLIGVSIHELMHNWYHGVLATNESLYPWMDEGFTVYATQKVMKHLIDKGFIPGAKPSTHLYRSAQNGYFNMVSSDIQEPMSTHADHYNLNTTYGLIAYSKGAIYLDQLGYIIGDDQLTNTLLAYNDRCKFTHPNPNDFRRIAENISGLELKWYNEYWVNTTKTIDYGIDTVFSREEKTEVILSRIGAMPMPLDIMVTLHSGETTLYNIPVDLMLGHKPEENYADSYVQMSPWKWTYPKYILRIDAPFAEVVKIEIDPKNRMADINRLNNAFPVTISKQKE